MGMTLAADFSSVACFTQVLTWASQNNLYPIIKMIIFKPATAGFDEVAFGPEG